MRRVQAQSLAYLLTRKALIDVAVEGAQEEHFVRLGSHLKRTMDQLWRKFKRVSIFENDQTITTIRHINGSAFTRTMTTADRFASEWQYILGVVHHKLQRSQLEAAFDVLVQVPANLCVSAFDNGIRMTTISLNEVITAIKDLNRHKAAGTDGINNDFSEDTQAVMAPAMVAMGNELLRVGNLLHSFWKGSLLLCANRTTRRIRWTTVRFISYKLGTISSPKSSPHACNAFWEINW